VATEFSRIEDYLKNNLSPVDKDKFEKELHSDSDLAEGLVFYKSLQHKENNAFHPIETAKKILPVIKYVSFLEKKKPAKKYNLAMAGVVVLFIGISLFILKTNNEAKKQLSGMELKADSLQSANKQVLGELMALKSYDQYDTTHSLLAFQKKELLLKNEILKKEQEIKALKAVKPNESDVTMLKELEELKKELAKTKQDMYEKNGQIANDQLEENVSMAELAKSISLRVLDENLEITWKSKDKIKISVERTDGGYLLESKEYMENKWMIKKPVDGFYYLKLYPSKGLYSLLLIQVKDKVRYWVEP